MKVWSDSSFVTAVTAANSADRVLVHLQHFGEPFDEDTNPWVVRRVPDHVLRCCANLLLHRDHVFRLEQERPYSGFRGQLDHESVYRIIDRCIGYDIAAALRRIATDNEVQAPNAAAGGFDLRRAIIPKIWPGTVQMSKPREPVEYDPPTAIAVMFEPAISRRRAQEAALAAKLMQDAESTDDEAMAEALAAAAEDVTELSAVLAADWVTDRAATLASAQTYATACQLEITFT